MYLCYAIYLDVRGARSRAKGSFFAMHSPRPPARPVQRGDACGDAMMMATHSLAYSLGIIHINAGYSASDLIEVQIKIKITSSSKSNSRVCSVPLGAGLQKRAPVAVSLVS